MSVQGPLLMDSNHADSVISYGTDPRSRRMSYEIASSPIGMKMGLALSGGGFRASLFHLGVIRRLAAEGRRAELVQGLIASVSGGSITAAHLLKNWDLYNSSR